MNPKPSVISTFKKSYGFLFSNFKELVLIAEPFIGLLLILQAGILVYGSPFFSFKLDEVSGFSSEISRAFWILLPMMLLSWIYLNKAMIGWFRLYIHGNDPEKVYRPFAFNINELEFLVRSTRFLVMVTLVGVIVYFCVGSLFILPILNASQVFPLHIMGSLINAAFVVLSIIFATYAVILLFFIRFTLYFPAKAAGYYISMFDSCDLFKGILIRFLIALSLVILPP